MNVFVLVYAYCASVHILNCFLHGAFVNFTSIDIRSMFVYCVGGVSELS